MISLTAVPLLRAATRLVVRTPRGADRGVHNDGLTQSLSPHASQSGSDSHDGLSHVPHEAASQAGVPTPQHAPRVILVGTETTAERLARLLRESPTSGRADGEISHAPLTSVPELCADQVCVEAVIGLSFPQDMKPLDEAVTRIAEGHFDWVILLSRPAVEYLATRCKARNVPAEALARLKVACVGAGTVRAAEAFGFHSHWVPTRAMASTFVEEALACDLFRGQRVLAPRSAMGDDEVLSPLRTQVAELHLVCAYENQPQPIDEPAWERYALVEPGVVVACLSSSAVTALWSGLPLSVQERLAKRATWLAVGPSTAETMRQVHLPPAAVADPPGLEQLAALIRERIAKV